MKLIERLLAFFGMRISPESMTRKAAGYAAREDVMRAVEYYKKALEADPEHVPAYDGLGRVYFRMGFREEAEREFAIASGLEKIRKDPTDVDAAVKMGRAMLVKGMHKSIPGHLEPVLKKSPHHPDLLKVMGAAYRALGNHERALELYRLALQRRTNDPEIYQQLAGLELKSGNKDQGELLNRISLLMAKTEFDGLDAVSRHELAGLLYKQGHFKEAAGYIRQAVDIDNGNPEYWLLLGECYDKSGLQPAAVDALKTACRLAPTDSRPHAALAELYQRLGRSDESRAEKTLADVIGSGSGESPTPEKAVRYVKYLMSVGLEDEAKTQLNGFRTTWPDNLELKLMFGRALYQDQRFEETIKVMKDVAQARDDWAEPHIWMAMAHQRLGDKMQALAEGQLATRLAPKGYTAHKVFGDILREQGKFGMAENAYETAENLKTAKKEKKLLE